MSFRDIGKIEEKELINLCANRDRNAQKVIYELFSPKMFAICLRYIGDREEALDLLHDGFILLFDKIGSYKGIGSFEGWIRKFFVNNALMYLRKRSLIRYPEEISVVDKEKINEETPLDHITSKELLKVVSSMPVGFRTVFNLYILEGYNHQEIADMLKITESSSRSQLSRARVWLKEHINDFK